MKQEGANEPTAELINQCVPTNLIFAKVTWLLVLVIFGSNAAFGLNQCVSEECLSGVKSCHGSDNHEESV